MASSPEIIFLVIICTREVRRRFLKSTKQTKAKDFQKGREAFKMKTKSATEKSEEEIRILLEQHFGAKDVEPNPKVGGKKADFRVKSIDTYVEVHALKEIASDQMDIVSQEKLAVGSITHWKLKDEGQKKILDRIANKLLNECTQLPEGKKNLIVTKTEGFLISPEDVIDSILGAPYISINKDNMKANVGHGATAFRTGSELLQILHKISAIIAYSTICQHGKLSGMIGNNENNAKVPFDRKTLSIFQSFLCDKC